MEKSNSTIEQQLLLMPRFERAKAQGLQGVFTINGKIVKRDSRRKWYVGGALLKLSAATVALW